MKGVTEKMSKRNIGFCINPVTNRPSKELLSKLAGIPIANLADNMNRMSCLEPSIKPYNKTPLLGVAFTVKAPDGDNLMLHKAMDMAEPGDVIVVSSVGRSERAFCGEIMMTYARERGIKGFVVDGFIRDKEGAENLENFSVYARGVTANGPYKNGPGEINVPVAVGGQVICPGDILCGDADGIVVIKPEEAQEVLTAGKALLEVETDRIQDILEGRGMDRTWMDPLLEKLGCSM